MQRLAIIVVLGAVGLGCGPVPEVDGGVPDSGVPGVDAGRADGGVDAGSSDGGFDAGSTDAGFDGGTNDGGRVDAGVDGGTALSCALLICQPWQQCREMGGVARCTGNVTISWFSPVTGASAPLDLPSIPLAINTDAPDTIDVPWTSTGALSSAGVFSGQPGVRAATLFLNNTDGGLVTLTAGWPGGPSATTQLLLTPAALQIAAPVPTHGFPSADFEPEDPAGRAWRRDEVVPLQLALPPPVAVFARLDAPGAPAFAASVTTTCDAGACWQFDLPLSQVPFPAFRGNVLVWATGSDGGIETRPQPIPVTRWRWRRQIAGVPGPLSVTRPITSGGTLLVGSADTATTGRLLRLDGSGRVVTSAPLAGWNQAVTTLSGSFATAVGVMGPDGGALVSLGSMLTPQASAAPFVASGGASSWTSAMSALGEVAVYESLGQRFSVACVTDGGTPYEAHAASSTYVTLLRGGGPLCVLPVQPPLTPLVSAGDYRPPFVKVGAHPYLDLIVSGAAGGLWSILRTPALTETHLLDAGVIDGLVLSTPASGARLFWVAADRSVNAAPLAVSPLTSAPLTRTLGAVTTSPTPLPRRARVSPIAAGSLYVVDEAGGLSSLDPQSLGLQWRLEPGDAGVRGARVDRDPIYANACEGLGSLLIPSSGDGSLYSVVGDLAALDVQERWPMGGATSSNTHEFTVPDVCVAR